VRQLLDRNTDISVQDKNGQTALHLAVQANSWLTVQLLLDRKADFGFQDKNGRTALHLAAQANSEETVKLLLDHGANINVVDKDGLTALFLGTSHTSRKEVKILLATWKSDDKSFPWMTSPNPHSQLQCNNRQHYFDGIRVICFSSTPPPTLFDRIKLGMESIVGVPIYWWPFRQPYTLCPFKHVTVKWIVRRNIANHEGG
jgi:hypothetical protein